MGVARLNSPSLYPNQIVDEPEYAKRPMADHEQQCIVGDYYGGAEEEDY